MPSVSDEDNELSYHEDLYNQLRFRDTQGCDCKRKILIVDDNQFNLMPLKYMIRRLILEMGTTVKNISSFETRFQLEFKRNPLMFQSMKNNKNSLPLRSSLFGTNLEQAKVTKQ